MKMLTGEVGCGSWNKAVSGCALAASAIAADGHPLGLPLSKPIRPSLASA
jgi:hypothetical protein